MLRITKKLLLDIEEMTKFYDDLGFRLKGSSIAANYTKDFTDADFVLKNPYSEIINNIIDINRCFIKCIPIEEILVLKGLIRTQLQNAIWLYAEYQQPLKILDKIYHKNRQLNQLPLKQSEIIKQLEELYPNIPISEIWVDTCKFVHPTADNWQYSNYLSNIRFFEAVKLPNIPKGAKKIWKGLTYKVPFNKIIRPDITNLVNINRIIIDTTHKLIQHNEEIIKSDAFKRDNYKMMLNAVKDYQTRIAKSSLT